MANEGFRKGDHWLIDARSGSKIRRSEAREEYTGQIVHKDDWEDRHPQEFVRGKRDKQSVDKPRPERVDQFNGPLITEVTVAANAGDLTVTVTSTARFADGDDVSIGLDNAEVFRVIVQDVSSTTTLLLTRPLPWAAAIGARVVNNTAMAADYGWDR